MKTKYSPQNAKIALSTYFSIVCKQCCHLKKCVVTLFKDLGFPLSSSSFLVSSSDQEAFNLFLPSFFLYFFIFFLKNSFYSNKIKQYEKK